MKKDKVLDSIKVDDNGNVLSEPIKENYSPNGYFEKERFEKDLKQYQQAQTIIERLKSDKEKIGKLEAEKKLAIELGKSTQRSSERYAIHLEAKVKELEEWKIGLVNLTVGGSEFVDDLEFCIKHIREERFNSHQRFLDRHKQLTQSQVEVKRLREGVDSVKNIPNESGHEGCTYGDTEYDSLSAVHGHNECLEHVKNLLKD